MNTLHELSEWNWEAEDNEGLLQVVTNQLGIEQIKHLVEALRQLRDIKRPQTLTTPVMRPTRT